MIVDDRLRRLREEKNRSLGDIAKRSRLPSCHAFLIESGHIILPVEALEGPSQALDVRLYQLFRDAEESPKLPSLLKRKTADEIVFTAAGRWPLPQELLRMTPTQAWPALDPPV